MKKIPKTITRVEIMEAFSEGKRAYYDGKRRGYNPYADIGHKELADAWYSGWDAAQEGKGNETPAPSKD